MSATDFRLVDARVKVLVDCDDCGGSGGHTFREPVGDHAANQTEPCPSCAGEGAYEETVTVMELVRVVLDHVPDGRVADVAMPEVIGKAERDEIAVRLRQVLTGAATRADQNGRGEIERQDALRTVQEAASSLRELRELGR